MNEKEAQGIFLFQTTGTTSGGRPFSFLNTVFYLWSLQKYI